jgi:hypothetical protein
MQVFFGNGCQSVGKNTLLFFYGLASCVSKKMKVCFVRLVKKLKNKKCALAKNKTSLRGLVGLAVSRSVMLSKNVRFMSVSLMLALSS